MVTHKYSSKVGAIIGIKGVYSGSIIRIPRCATVRIGRDSSVCDIAISSDCTKISRVHCAVSYDLINNFYIITDTSTNGTFIESNGEVTMIKNQSSRALSGDKIWLGDKSNGFDLL